MKKLRISFSLPETSHLSKTIVNQLNFRTVWELLDWLAIHRSRFRKSGALPEKGRVGAKKQRIEQLCDDEVKDSDAVADYIMDAEAVC
jgi:predicted helicase